MIERFLSIVAARLGIQCDVAHATEALARRLRETRSESVEVYLDRLEAGAPAELRALAEALTIGETYFHRGADHFRAFVEEVLPDRLRARAGARLRLLSAGCASGEEPYTLAMLCRERGLGANEVEIVGIDVNHEHLELAARARYGAWSLREIAVPDRARWFEERGREHVLRPEIKELVRFEERNLLDDDGRFWAADSFDVIFCRNVLIYFTPVAITTTLARMAGALAPGGFLFLGHSESLRATSTAFDTINACDTFYYRLRGHDAPSPTPPPIARTTRPSPPRTAPPPPAPVAVVGPDLDDVLALVKTEQWPEAMALLGSLPASLAGTRDGRLIRAAVLMNLGAHAEAAEVCATLLADDESDPDAHYLEALGREHAGDRAGAALRARTAAHLDPGFAMPRLLLGRGLRRQGNLDAARRELSQAFDLLAHEQPRRVLLYAGGFGREALRQMCRAELAGVPLKERV